MTAAKNKKRHETKNWYSATATRSSNQFNDATNWNWKENAIRHLAAPEQLWR